MNSAVSNLDTTFYRKSSQGLRVAGDLDAETARVFAVLDENIQLSKVAKLASVSTAVLWKAIAKLTRLELIENADGDVGFMSKTFVDAMQNEFAKSVGPIGHILLKNAAVEMDISLPNIPVERARELVCKLADQIPDDQASAEFQRTLLKDI